MSFLESKRVRGLKAGLTRFRRSRHYFGKDGDTNSSVHESISATDRVNR